MKIHQKHVFSLGYEVTSYQNSRFIMLRMPNPGSNINIIIKIFVEIHTVLRNQVVFELDDMTNVLISKKLASSCGFVGKMALVKSQRADRSRDPLYNQSKSYSELFKILGWIHPLEKSALKFRFTYLGDHIVNSYNHNNFSLPIMCILAITYPNQIIQVQNQLALRPIVSIIKAMGFLENMICRDEMIIGPLSLENDRDAKTFSRMINSIKKMRVNEGELNKELDKLSDTRNISKTTMGNYTRFPIAFLKWSGFIKVVRTSKYHGRNTIFFQLTEFGQNILMKINQQIDFRSEDLKIFSTQEQTSIIRYSFFKMLFESGFDISLISKSYEIDSLTIKNKFGDNQLFFSPFQELHASQLDSIFSLEGEGSLMEVEEKKRQKVIDNSNIVQNNKKLFSVVQLVTGEQKKIQEDSRLTSLFLTDELRGLSTNNKIELLLKKMNRATQNYFYPLVADLFGLLGFDCRYSRPGVNYERHDAIIVDDVDSIPIEIKSPGEEQFISTKAIRQALENKIVLLSRKSFPTKRSSSSLVVGYLLPSDRSEVQNLINDIFVTYKIKIGVIDIESLLRIVALTYLEKKTFDAESLKNLYGIINVKDI